MLDLIRESGPLVLTDSTELPIFAHDVADLTDTVCVAQHHYGDAVQVRVGDTLGSVDKTKSVKIQPGQSATVEAGLDAQTPAPDFRLSKRTDPNGLGIAVVSYRVYRRVGPAGSARKH